MVVNIHVKSSRSLVTTPESRRSGFLEYALRRNRESVPFIDKSKALKAVLENKTRTAYDILKIPNIRESILEAAGISVKAKAHLTDEDKGRLLNEFVEKILVPCQTQYIEEIVYRYLLTSGDALGGKMRNIVGSIASEKFTRFLISQLQISTIPFSYALKDGIFKDGIHYRIDEAEKIKAIEWKIANNVDRFLIYNINVPRVNKNIDIVLLNTNLNTMRRSDFKLILNDRQSYLAIGELKGGIDPAGADEHWKTANTALGRVRTAFNGELPIFFIGAAIEAAMAEEIYAQYSTSELANCANLTNDNQLASLCEWLVRL